MDDSAHPHVLTDPARLEALRAADLLDTPPEEEFDQIAQQAAELLGAPIALVSLVDGDRQFFKSVVGLAEPWASARQTGLDRSACQHVVRAGATVAITDTRSDPRVRESHRIADAGLAAYAGAPLRTADGHTLGSLCVLDERPREWTATELATLGELAERAVSAIERRAARVRAANAGRTERAPASPDEEARALAAADRLWEATDRFLAALEAYDAQVARGDPEQERAARHAVTDGERAMLAAAEALGQDGARQVAAALPETLVPATRALWLAALYYLERRAYRRSASVRFLQDPAALEEVERAATLIRVAQSELERAAATFRRLRIERRGRTR